MCVYNRLGLWKQIFEEKEAGELFELPLNHVQFEYDFLVAKENIFQRVMTKSYICKFVLYML